MEDQQGIDASDILAVSVQLLLGLSAIDPSVDSGITAWILLP